MLWVAVAAGAVVGGALLWRGSPRAPDGASSERVPIGRRSPELLVPAPEDGDRVERRRAAAWNQQQRRRALASEGAPRAARRSPSGRLVAIGYKIRLKQFRAAREELEAFAKAHPDPAPALRARRQELAALFERMRNDYFRNEARVYFPKYVRTRLGILTRQSDASYTGALAFLRRELTELAFSDLTRRLQEKDEVTREQARAFWDARRKRAWWTASFGVGGDRLESVERDRWWEAATPEMRVDHLLARFARDSGLFELADDEFNRPGQVRFR